MSTPARVMKTSGPRPLPPSSSLASLASSGPSAARKPVGARPLPSIRSSMSSSTASLASTSEDHSRESTSNERSASRSRNAAVEQSTPARARTVAPIITINGNDSPPSSSTSTSPDPSSSSTSAWSSAPENTSRSRHRRMHSDVPLDMDYEDEDAYLFRSPTDDSARPHVSWKPITTSIKAAIGGMQLKMPPLTRLLSSATTSSGGDSSQTSTAEPSCPPSPTVRPLIEDADERSADRSTPNTMLLQPILKDASGSSSLPFPTVSPSPPTPRSAPPHSQSLDEAPSTPSVPALVIKKRRASLPVDVVIEAIRKSSPPPLGQLQFVQARQ